MSNHENGQSTGKVKTDAGYSGIVIAILVSFLLLLVGILMTFLPSMQVKYFCYIAGGFLLGLGVSKIVRYFVKEEFRWVNNYDFSLGVLSTIIGLVIIVRAEEIGDHFLAGLGVLILATGVIVLQHAVQMLASKSGFGYVVLLISIAMLVLSALILLDVQNPITKDLSILYITLIVIGGLGVLSQILIALRLVFVRRKEEKVIEVQEKSKEYEQDYLVSVEDPEEQNENLEESPEE